MSAIGWICNSGCCMWYCHRHMRILHIYPSLEGKAWVNILHLSSMVCVKNTTDTTKWDGGGETSVPTQYGALGFDTCVRQNSKKLNCVTFVCDSIHLFKNSGLWIIVNLAHNIQVSNLNVRTTYRNRKRYKYHSFSWQCVWLSNNRETTTMTGKDMERQWVWYLKSNLTPIQVILTQICL